MVRQRLLGAASADVSSEPEAARQGTDSLIRIHHSVSADLPDLLGRPRVPRCRFTDGPLTSSTIIPDSDMDIVELPLERLIPYARNPRRNEDAIATVAASLAEFGWRQPIVVDEDDGDPRRPHPARGGEAARPHERAGAHRRTG